MFDKLFDFNNTENLVQSMTQASNQIAAADKEAADKIAEQAAVVTQSAERYNAQAQQSLERLQTVDAKGAESRRLAESDNIFDRVTLIGEQILNPRDYTREGRTNQISEMTQSLAAHGQVFNVENNLAQAKVNQAQADNTAAKVGANSQMNLLRANIEGIQLMSEGMRATEQMRQINLMTADMPTLLQAQQTPPDPNLKGKISLNGMTYTPGELRERQNALETREKLAFLSPQATDPKYAQALNVQHDMTLATFSLPELETLKTNGYIMPDGTQVQPGMWDAHYQRQQVMQQQAFEQTMNQSMLENQVPMMMKDSFQMTQNVGKWAEPGTPLAVANNMFLAAANQVADLASRDTTPTGKIRQVGELQKNQQMLIKAIDTEANRKAAGDKQLADIYRSQILGQPIQSSQVEDVIRSRYIKNSGLGEFLPNDSAQRIKETADKAYNAIKQSAAKDLTGMEIQWNDKQIREQAVNQAIEKERKTIGVQGINMIQKGITQRTDMPAIKSGVMVPDEILRTQQSAVTRAFRDVSPKYALDDEKIMALKNGQHESVGISKEKAALILDQVNNLSVMYEYDAFEAKKPGLGYEMEQWYQKTLPEAARNYTANLDPTTQAMTGDAVLNQAQLLAARYTQADESATSRAEKLATEVAVGAKKPENMWPVLLQMQDNLTDSQRQSIYFDVVEPAIKQARSTDSDDKATSAAVFNALIQYKSEDPTMMAALKSMQRGLPKELDRFEYMWSSMMNKGEESKVYGRRISRDPNLAANKISKTLPWMNRE